MLLLHIIAATLSMVSAGWLWVRPSSRSLFLTGSSFILTLISGTGLILMSTPTHLGITCLFGAGYFAFVGLCIVRARRQMVQQ